MKLKHVFFFAVICSFFLICEVSVGQIKIKERINISPSFKQTGRAVNTRYPMEATVTFPRTSYEFGYEPDIQLGYVLGKLALYTPLSSGGTYTHTQDTSSFGSMNISWNPKSEATYYSEIIFYYYFRTRTTPRRLSCEFESRSRLRNCFRYNF